MGFQRAPGGGARCRYGQRLAQLDYSLAVMRQLPETMDDLLGHALVGLGIDHLRESGQAGQELLEPEAQTVVLEYERFLARKDRAMAPHGAEAAVPAGTHGKLRDVVVTGADGTPKSARSSTSSPAVARTIRF